MNIHLTVLKVTLISFLLYACVNNKKSDLGPKICLTATDSATISFSKDIFPIIQAECISCHNSSTANGGYFFESYQNIADNAFDINSAITASNNYQRMPQSGPMDHCKIEKISTWIKNGKPNN